MKPYLDCFPCFLQQKLRAPRLATSDEKILKKIIDEIGMIPNNISMKT